jgi:hypothetical protein
MTGLKIHGKKKIDGITKEFAYSSNNFLWMLLIVNNVMSMESNLKYTQINEFYEGFVAVELDGKCGFFDE